MLLCAIIPAGLMPIFHIGRQGLFYWIFAYPNVMGIWPQFRSPLLWDFVCIICYLLTSIFFYYVGMLPDLATVRDRARTRVTQILCGVRALGCGGSALHWAAYRTVYLVMAAIMAPMVISVHSVVGLDFAGGLTPGWHSTQFPPYFFFGAVISGLALVIMLTIFVRHACHLQGVITAYHLNALGKVMQDPEKVAKAKTKAEGFLSKYVGDDEANQVVNELEGLLGTFAHHPDSEKHE